MASFTAEAHQAARGKAISQTDAMGWDARVTTDSHAGSYGPEPKNPVVFSMAGEAVEDLERERCWADAKEGQWALRTRAVKLTVCLA